MNQYPSDFNPANRGRCRWPLHAAVKLGAGPCGVETKANDRRWLDLCPNHWQALFKLKVKR